MKLKKVLIYLTVGVVVGNVVLYNYAYSQNGLYDNDNYNDAIALTARFNDSYDSLLNTYYLKKYTKHSVRHDGSLSLEEFDQVPDSVIAKRLKQLHTVIPMTYNDAVRSYIRLYLRVMSKKLDVMVSLCEMYHPMFEETLAKYGVPEELKYLTIVESAMNPMATSRVGAAGLWQFMYRTGKNYDLEVNSVVDQRRDPYASTVAAARYIRDLHSIFNDWTLAIAAYNCGPGNINKAIARSGGKTDFWEIYNFLPRETRGYIPAFIAATYVMKYYPEHGIKPHKIELPMRTDTIELKQDVFYCYVKDFVDIDEDELRTLNPQYKTDFIPASTGNYAINIPAEKIHQFIQFEDSIYAHTRDSLSKKPVVVAPTGKSSTPSSGSSTVYHKVKQGETLTKIANKYGTTVAQLRKRNGLKGDRIRVGQRIRVR